jgi:hypothetical protein
VGQLQVVSCKLQVVRSQLERRRQLSSEMELCSTRKRSRKKTTL